MINTSRVLLVLAFILITISARGGEVLADWYWRNALPQGNAICNVVHANSKYVAVGEMGTLLTSMDGTNWMRRETGTAIDLRDCAYGAGRYVVVGDFGTVLTSTDLQTWVPQYSGTFYSLNGVVFANNQFVCVGDETSILTSTDGTTWLPQSSGPWDLRDVIFADGLYVAAGGNMVNFPAARVLLTSTNAQTWQLRVAARGNSFETLAYGGGRFAATTSADPWNGLTPLWSSTNGIDWLPAPAPPISLNRATIAYGSSRWVLVSGDSAYATFPGQPGEIVWSDDLVNWNLAFTNAASILAICYGGGQFVAGRADGAFVLSSNAVNWRNPWPDLGSVPLTDLAFLNGQFVGLNYQRFIFSSNGISWTSAPSPTNTGSLFSITYGEGLYVAGGEYRMVWTSTNGVDWINPATNLSIYPYSGPVHVTYGKGVFVGAAGFQADILTSEDGLNWTVQALVTNDNDYVYFSDITFADGRFVAVAGSTIATSVDGTNWLTIRTNLGLYQVTGGAGKFVAVGGSTIATSTDGTNWLVQQINDTSYLYDVAYGAGWFVATTGIYNSPSLIKQPRPFWVSPDGIHWSRRNSTTPQGIGPIAFGDGAFVTGTQNGGILQSDPMVTLNMKVTPYPQLEISGPIYRQYQIERRDMAAATIGWSSLGIITITNTPGLFTDESGPNVSGHMYRTVLLP